MLYYFYISPKITHVTNNRMKPVPNPLDPQLQFHLQIQPGTKREEERPLPSKSRDLRRNISTTVLWVISELGSNGTDHISGPWGGVKWHLHLDQTLTYSTTVLWAISELGSNGTDHISGPWGGVASSELSVAARHSIHHLQTLQAWYYVSARDQCLFLALK